MAVPDRVGEPLRVGVLSRSNRQRQRLGDILEANGLEVVTEDLLRGHQNNDAGYEAVDVLLVDLDDREAWEPDVLDGLIEQVTVPILFNDGSATKAPSTISGKAWGRRLAGKLIELVNEAEDAAPRVAPHSRVSESSVTGLEDKSGQPVSPRALTQAAADAEEAVVNNEVAGMAEALPSPAAHIEFEHRVETTARRAVGEAEQVCVLGASIGGPQAVQSFLAELPPDTPAGFIVAQHIGPGFVQLLAQQLRRSTDLDVVCAERGQVLRNGQVLVAPVERELEFDSQGAVVLREITYKSVYKPSIDAVMLAAARRYESNTRAILFSGMGSDGIDGCRAIVSQGGEVWAQTDETCVISSMADAARDAGIAVYSGTPEQMAHRLAEQLQAE